MDNEINTILKFLIYDDMMDFKCFNVLKEKLNEDKQFREKVKEGIKAGLITKFPRDIIDNFNELNIRAPFKPIQILIDGANIGTCTYMSKLVSYSLSSCYICGGTLKVLEGTQNSPDGRHTWISYNGNILDTTLMIQINEKFKEQLGYTEENRHNPNIDPIYSSAKEFANDKSINRKR